MRCEEVKRVGFMCGSRTDPRLAPRDTSNHGVTYGSSQVLKNLLCEAKKEKRKESFGVSSWGKKNEKIQMKLNKLTVVVAVKNVRKLQFSSLKQNSSMG